MSATYTYWQRTRAVSQRQLGFLFFVVSVAYTQWWDIFSMAAKSTFITELNNDIMH